MSRLLLVSTYLNSIIAKNKLEQISDYQLSVQDVIWIDSK